MGINIDEKYPYPGIQKYYQLTDGTNNAKTTQTSHAKYYSTEEVDNLIKGVLEKITASNGIITESVTFDQLPTPSAENAGTIYNVTGTFVSDSRFIDGPDKKYPAGANVIVMKTGDTYKFDVMMGEIEEASSAGIQDIIDSL